MQGMASFFWTVCKELQENNLYRLRRVYKLFFYNSLPKRKKGRGFMERWRERIGRWKFDRKMQAIIIISITFTTLLVMIVSTVSSVTSLKEKSIELLQDKNSTLEENYRNMLEEYKTMSVALVIDQSIQNYMEFSSKQDTGYAPAAREANNVLSSSLNMSSDMNFVAAISGQMEDYLYRGRGSLAATEFYQMYEKDLAQSRTGQASTLKIGFSNAYFRGEQYTVNVYFPIYSVEKVMEEQGLLCMNFSNPVLNQIINQEEAGQRTEIVGTDGAVVAVGDTEKIGTLVDYREHLAGNQGCFRQNGRIYIYQKVSGWNYYIISSIDSMELYRPSIRMIGLMVVILLVLVIISYIIVKKVIRKAYRPLNQVVQKMDNVAAGSLDVRLDVGYMGEDFAKLATGFNSMMEEIMVLMEQVKQEQHQIEQIRFNSLQSQIQPHFLYSTLDCIHWQAVADGNREISTLVKALARYYRICLSKGHDVIPIEMEIEHVQNYLIIQNMRYDHIIGSEISLGEECAGAMIPKLTLQPLVENSIYHGIKVKQGTEGSITLRAERQGEIVKIILADTGTGMTQAQIDEMNQHLSEYDESFGYGVRNVNKRIELLYGDGYGLHYLKNPSGGLTVEIRIPYVEEVQEELMRGVMINV